MKYTLELTQDILKFKNNKIKVTLNNKTTTKEIIPIGVYSSKKWSYFHNVKKLHELLKSSKIFGKYTDYIIKNMLSGTVTVSKKNHFAIACFFRGFFSHLKMNLVSFIDKKGSLYTYHLINLGVKNNITNDRLTNVIMTFQNITGSNMGRIIPFNKPIKFNKKFEPSPKLNNILKEYTNITSLN
jgi:hypothetical protein